MFINYLPDPIKYYTGMPVAPVIFSMSAYNGVCKADPAKPILLTL